MANYSYITSCVFSRDYPELSRRALGYIQSKGIPAMRCCVEKYKVREFEELVGGEMSGVWPALPHYLPMTQDETVISVCHNCTNILAETRPDLRVISLYEYILQDPDFVFPDYHGREITIQDCWRAQDHEAEKAAVRELLKRMNFCTVEIPEPEDFCGISLLMPQPVRNPRMAPLHYGPDKVVGKFGTYTPEEQAAIMARHGEKIPTDQVVCYCHYCLTGLELSGKEAFHIVDLLFPKET